MTPSARAIIATALLCNSLSAPRSGGGSLALAQTAPPSPAFVLETYALPRGSAPHDVAPAPDGRVWYTAQGRGELGLLDPASGLIRQIPLGAGSAPHGVIVGPDQAAWVTDSGLNAIVRVDACTEAIKVFPLPPGSAYANLNTAAFDASGRLWFTGQSGYYGRLDPPSGKVELFPAPRGRGPYGIALAPDGALYYASLAGNHIARIDPLTGIARPIEPPTRNQGARRVWPDSRGRIWVSEWNSGQLSVYDPPSAGWRAWRLPGPAPRAYAVYVDWRDGVWVSDYGANALLRFEPSSERFETYALPDAGASVRQILGRPGEIWAAESGADRLLVLRAGR